MHLRSSASDEKLSPKPETMPLLLLSSFLMRSSLIPSAPCMKRRRITVVLALPSFRFRMANHGRRSEKELWKTFFHFLSARSIQTASPSSSSARRDRHILIFSLCLCIFQLLCPVSLLAYFLVFPPSCKLPKLPWILTLPRTVDSCVFLNASNHFPQA